MYLGLRVRKCSLVGPQLEICELAEDDVVHLLGQLLPDSVVLPPPQQVSLHHGVQPLLPVLTLEHTLGIGSGNAHYHHDQPSSPVLPLESRAQLPRLILVAPCSSNFLFLEYRYPTDQTRVLWAQDYSLIAHTRLTQLWSLSKPPALAQIVQTRCWSTALMSVALFSSKYFSSTMASTRQSNHILIQKRDRLLCNLMMMSFAARGDS